MVILLNQVSIVMMMIKKIQIGASAMLIALLMLCPAANAKNKYPKDDRGTWGTFALDYDLNKSFSLEFAQELRYYKNYKVLDQSLTDIGFMYNVTDWFGAGLSYRYKALFDEDEEDDDYAQEIHANFNFKYKLLGFSLKDRVRLQSRFYENEEDEYFFRNKLTLEYKELADWVSPFCSAELFHIIGAGSDNKINKARFALGLDFEPFENHEIGVYFLRENEFNKKKIVNSNIIGIEYTLSLN